MKGPIKTPPGFSDKDYYYNESGLFVITEKGHRRRGYCCGNACLHCPFGWENVDAKNIPLSKGIGNTDIQEK